MAPVCVGPRHRLGTDARFGRTSTLLTPLLLSDVVAARRRQGSGGIGRTNVGGPDASFGVWHELLPEIRQVVSRYRLVVERVHTHIGSGSDPAVWTKVSQLSLKMCQLFPTVTTLNLGGGYKVGIEDAYVPHAPCTTIVLHAHHYIPSRLHSLASTVSQSRLRTCTPTRWPMQVGRMPADAASSTYGGLGSIVERVSLFSRVVRSVKSSFSR